MKKEYKILDWSLNNLHQSYYAEEVVKLEKHLNELAADGWKIIYCCHERVSVIIMERDAK